MSCKIRLWNVLFGASLGPRIVVNSKDQQGEGLVKFTRHFAVVSCLVIKFGASWRGGHRR